MPDSQNKDLQNKNLQNKDLQSKDLQNKDLQNKNLQSKDLQRKDLQNKGSQSKALQSKKKINLHVVFRAELEQSADLADELFRELLEEDGLSVVVTDDRKLIEELDHQNICCIGYQDQNLDEDGFFPGTAEVIGSLDVLSDAFIRSCYAHYHGIPFVIAEGFYLPGSGTLSMADSGQNTLKRYYRLRESTGEDAAFLIPLLSAFEYDVFTNEPDEYDDRTRTARDEKSSPKCMEPCEGSPDSIEEAAEQFCRYIENAYTFWNYGLWTVEVDGQPAGWCGLMPGKIEVDGEYVPELGYVLSPSFRGQGLALMTCRIIMDYAQRELGYNGLTARVRKDNTASVKLLKRLGFVRQSGQIVSEKQEKTGTGGQKEKTGTGGQQEKTGINGQHAKTGGTMAEVDIYILRRHRQEE